MQLLPGSTVVPVQPSTLLPKSPAFGPPVPPTVEMMRLAVPVLVMVIAGAKALVPTFCGGNVRLAGDRLMAGAATKSDAIFATKALITPPKADRKSTRLNSSH